MEALVRGLMYSEGKSSTLRHLGIEVKWIMGLSALVDAMHAGAFPVLDSLRLDLTSVWLEDGEEHRVAKFLAAFKAQTPRLGALWACQSSSAGLLSALVVDGACPDLRSLRVVVSSQEAQQEWEQHGVLEPFQEEELLREVLAGRCPCTAGLKVLHLQTICSAPFFSRLAACLTKPTAVRLEELHVSGEGGCE
jgi:hypothetical protein